MDDPSSTRIEGGAVRIVEELTNQIRASDKKESDSIASSENRSRIMLNTPITTCTLLNDCHNKNSRDDKVLVQLATSSGELFLSRKVIFAVPPKIISDSITFNPPLTEAKTAAMAKSSTWMAGVTKVALLYPKRFWSADSSNSGLPASMGPAFQVYDSSTNNGSLAALTFFVHVPENDEPAQSDDAILATQVAEQMGQLWKYSGKMDSFGNTASGT